MAGVFKYACVNGHNWHAHGSLLQLCARCYWWGIAIELDGRKITSIQLRNLRRAEHHYKKKQRKHGATVAAR